MKRFLVCLLLILIPASMSVAGTYSSTSVPLQLRPYGCQTLFVAADGSPITTGTFSTQFELASPPSVSGATPNLSFELIWSGNPGAFNIQIQDADTDATGNYITLTNAGTITSSAQSAGGTFASRVELAPWTARYGRLYVNTQAANAVTLTAKVCRR